MHYTHVKITRFCLCLLLGLAAVSALGAQSADSAQWYNGGPWEQELFSKDTDAVRKAASASHFPSPQPVTVFMSSGRADFRADGSLEHRNVLVYRIETDDGVKNWSDIEIGWSPWHQDAPRLRVRILNPDGKIYSLTEKDLIEVTSGSGDDKLYTDRKTLKAPYPNVLIGSIIEEELITVTRPYLPNSGMEDDWTFTRKNAIGLNRFVVSYPAGTPLQYVTAAMDKPDPVKTVKDSRTILTWEFRNQAPSPQWEDNTPPETRQKPEVTVGTAASWQTIAEGYAAESEKVFSMEPFPLPKDLELPRSDAKAAAVAASRWINGRVRYTGMELGQNSIIPFPPQTVISRGYGDCKDKASLMVNILRAAGYKAYLSLILAGPGWDINPALSGMTSFNHVIVYIDEAGGFWFDPTVEINHDASLPYQDQYRYTLIARPGQKELSRTPLSPSSTNLVTEYRDITMVDSGKGSVVETMEYSGALDTYYRNIHPYQDLKKAKEQLEAYADSYYETKKVTRTEWSDPRDLTTPFRMVIAASEIAQSVTGDTTAEVAIHLNNMRSFFPDAMLDEKVKPRVQAFRLNIPMSYRLIAVIHPPAGFLPRSVPDPIELSTPEFLFRRSWEGQADGSLKGITDFEWKQVEFSPAEFETTRADLKKMFADHNQAIVTFDHQGEILRAEGRYAEAFDCYRSLLQANPDSAMQNKRLSVALLSYSLGQPATFYARKATELEPTNADMWENLANMLMNDGLGRRLNKGYDREGAIAAWRKAMELDPENKAHQANLAILYEYNESGERYQNPGDLKLAGAEYQGLGKAMDTYQLYFNFWSVQIRLGEMDAAKQLIPNIKDEEQRNIAKVVTAVLTGNTAPPMKLLEQSLTLEKKQSTLINAADILVSLRRYQDASRLIRQAAVANKDAGNLENRADILERIIARDSAGIDCTTPVGTLKNFFFDYLNGGASNPALYTKYFAKSFLDGMGDIGADSLSQKLENLINPVMGDSAAHFKSDITMSILNFESSGDDVNGYRLIAGFDGAGEASFVFYLVKEGSGFRIVAWDPLYSVMGRQILAYLDSGANDSAVMWFNWIFQPNKAQNVSSLSLQFFTDERLPRSPYLMRQVAELLTLRDKSRGKAAAGIDAFWQKISNRDRFLSEAGKQGIPAELRKDLWNTLAFNLADIGTKNQAFDKAGLIARELAKYLKGDTQFIPWYALNLALWGQDAEAETIIETLRAARPDDRDVFSALLSVYQTTLNFAKLDAETAKYPSRLSGMDLNNLAWDELFRDPNGTLAPIALERSRKSVNLGQSRSRPELHTLATIYATIGRFDEARSMLSKAIELNSGNEPTSDDWYIIGLIADGYGFHDAAVEAWNKVVRDENSIPTKTDTWILAQNRLK